MEGLTNEDKNFWGSVPEINGPMSKNSSWEMLLCIQVYCNLKSFYKEAFINLKDVWEITEYKFEADFEKRKYVMPEVKVLRHLVSQKEIQPDPKKVDLYRTYLLLKMLRVKSFMRVISYLIKFIPNCSILAEPLIKFTRGIFFLI